MIETKSPIESVYTMSQVSSLRVSKEKRVVSKGRKRGKDSVQT